MARFGSSLSSRRTKNLGTTLICGHHSQESLRTERLQTMRQVKPVALAVLLFALSLQCSLAALAAAGIDQTATVSADQSDAKPRNVDLAQPEITNLIGMKLVLFPAGKFTMGSPKDEQGRDEDEEQHEVEITRAFYLGKCEVTMGQFRSFARDSDYRTEPERDGSGGSGYSEQAGLWKLEGRRPQYSWKDTGFPQSEDHPVLNVTWNDAIAFCDWLSHKERRKYRLPTEAEWEYGCRAKTTTRYYSGNDEASLAHVANVADTSAKTKFPSLRATTSHEDGYAFTAPVGELRSNAFGLHDMHGNLWEWCADWYEADYYKNCPRQDPLGPTTGITRVARSGCWNEGSRTCRSADRSKGIPSYRSSGVGFRVVLTIPAADR